MLLEERIKLLKTKIGLPYKMFFDDGNYCGCFFPIYQVFPHLPHYPLPSHDPAKSWDYGVNLIEKHFNEIFEQDMRTGDMLVTRYKNELHVALCINHDKIIHVFRGHKLQINRRNFFKNREIRIFRL